ncbi:MAG TPA: MotA/TolQ/ExbB proton channel family protein [Bacteroidia bacterium]|nr:MotA/TolQ/ExbB proton channel family protein [Bacteroidia bacterium]
MLFLIMQTGSGLTGAAADSSNLPLNTGIQSAGIQEASETSMPLIEMVIKGGPMMIPLAILLIVAIYVLIERMLVIGKASKHNSQFLSSLKDIIHQGNIPNAIALCRNMNTPEGSMIEQGVSRIGQPVQEIRAAMDKSGSNEIAKLEKNLTVLNIIGRIAPMFGFIGTIIGVITIFYSISIAKTVEIEIISKGLYQKMITSASGLVVGVLAFICYHWLNSRIDRLARNMEESQIRFLDILNEPAK